MKHRNPKSRFDLNINKNDLVLEIGGGHNPHPRADYVVDKFITDNSHRNGDLKVLDSQIFIEADGENLPFEDKTFDYVICCHVLEHVENPEAFLSEMMRVAKRGYIEVPNLIGEFLAPKQSHKWVSLEVDNKLTLVDKKEIGMDQPSSDFGDLFLYHLQKVSVPFKILKKSRPNLFSVRIEWDTELHFNLNPSDKLIEEYFENWDAKKMEEFFPSQSKSSEIKNLLFALGKLIFNYGVEKIKKSIQVIDLIASFPKNRLARLANKPVKI